MSRGLQEEARDAAAVGFDRVHSPEVESVVRKAYRPEATKLAGEVWPYVTAMGRSRSKARSTLSAHARRKRGEPGSHLRMRAQIPRDTVAMRSRSVRTLTFGA